ncbi:NAD(P)H-binding protein [Nocardiopsis suaedae]|uniref:NAD(P)H-binding protein n=1 Tax=Nocardiopsis suaedae TaxID=3018444 RepID=A0ABT4TLR9_9ACTN|nr:NAD(P)H-binding protein [Nocardiopsis suaedae]MDA2805643.1 NAD(P)H-binding protein [Nocardiopsis suaedae]
MDTRPVLVIGGTGTIGRRVVAALRDEGVPVRAASRRSEVHFDWDDPGTWAAALDGVRAAFITPLDVPPSRTPALVGQAVAAGAERLVLLSARGVEVPGYFGPESVITECHLAGERAVRTSGAAWTVLKPAWFAQNFSEGLFRDGVVAGELALPVGGGRAAFVDADDIAAVAVAALTEEGHDGQEYELSGPRALGVADALAEISRATGRPARFADVTVEGFTEMLAGVGVPAEDAAVWANALTPIRTSGDAVIADGVERALGRPPRDFAAFADDAAKSGAWEG